MARTRVSPKYQVVIPKEIRERHGLKPGQEMQVISKGETITLVPDRPLSAFRGILRGMPTTGYREARVLTDGALADDTRVHPEAPDAAIAPTSYTIAAEPISGWARTKATRFPM